jgi:hypothetical protein
MLRSRLRNTTKRGGIGSSLVKTGIGEYRCLWKLRVQPGCTGHRFSRPLPSGPWEHILRVPGTRRSLYFPFLPSSRHPYVQTFQDDFRFEINSM